MRSVRQFSLLIVSAVCLVVSGCAPQNVIHNNPSSSPVTPQPTVSARPLESPASPETPVAPDVAQEAEADIWTQMQQGTGYVVLLRHAQTVAGTGDPPGFQLNDCATQRNLSEAGREQAARIGQVFRDRNIPIHQILSSQYCRCLDTAKLLNLGEVEPSPMLNSTFTNRANEAEQTAQVRQRILDHQNTPGVIVMVSHFVNIGDISGINPPSGGAVIMRTNQQGELEVAEQIRDW
ncbi:MAG: histidine phosphatase family protein [Leptolyngbyaceae cyanobacterium SL_5_9]|nr:histidine phosphatase family protein [Leptolyngbyaceae cyanobacterium SL_5_9]NJO73301.1 histidine phosphatase family protein [Leptolyngbyaceae cyanobacterium RM1_406_9]